MEHSDEQEFENSLRPKRLREFIGQQEIKDKLTIVIQAARAREEVLDHVLLCGVPGLGKSTLANIIANELGVAFQGTSARVIENKKDLAAILSNVEKLQVLMIKDVHRLQRWACELLSPALQDFHIDYVVEKGPARRTIKLNVAPFTLIGTVPKQADCPPDILEDFTFILPFEKYSNTELEQITYLIAEKLGFPSLALPIVRSIVAGCRGSPRQIKLLLTRLAKMGGGKITEVDARRLLPLLGLNYQSGDLPGHGPNLQQLSGVRFEELITQLLDRMGFRAQMTKASGDGGIDIVAELGKPMIGGRYLIQCKRLAPDSLVGAAIVREFYGALTADRKAVKGILITTSGFTAQAREFAEGLPLELIDGDHLHILLAEYGMGNPSGLATD